MQLQRGGEVSPQWAEAAQGPRAGEKRDPERQPANGEGASGSWFGAGVGAIY